MSVLIVIILFIIIIKLMAEGFWTFLKWSAIITLVIIILGAMLQ